MFLSVGKVAIVVYLYCFIYSSRTDGTTVLPKDANVSAFLVFGDSFVDQGNNNYVNTLAKANFPPYGKDFMGGKPTGRFSNGKTIADFLGTYIFSSIFIDIVKSNTTNRY